MSAMVFLGIDPGKGGGIVGIDETGKVPVIFSPMPTRDDRGIDFRLLMELVGAPSIAHICLEHVHAIHGCGAGTTFEFGGAFYAAMMAADLSERPYTLVQPKKWQKTMFEGVPVIPKAKGTPDTKKMAWTAVQRLFPTIASTMVGGRKTKPHDGMVDALLLAEYCRRNFR